MTNIETGNDQQPAVRAKYGSSLRKQGKIANSVDSRLSGCPDIFPDGRADVPGGAQSLKACEFVAVAQDSA